MLKRHLATLKSKLSLLAKRASIDKTKFAWVLRIWSENGAGNEIRTRDPNHGKVVLYPLAIPARISRILQAVKISRLSQGKI